MERRLPHVETKLVSGTEVARVKTRHSCPKPRSLDGGCSSRSHLQLATHIVNTVDEIGTFLVYTSNQNKQYTGEQHGNSYRWRCITACICVRVLENCQRQSDLGHTSTSWAGEEAMLLLISLCPVQFCEFEPGILTRDLARAHQDTQRWTKNKTVHFSLI